MVFGCRRFRIAEADAHAEGEMPGKSSNKDKEKGKPQGKEKSSPPNAAKPGHAEQKHEKPHSSEPHAEKPVQGQRAHPAEEPADLFETRLAKLEELRASGIDPYAQSFEKKHVVRDLLAIPTTDHASVGPFTVAGRIRSRRLMGKAGFMDLEDETGRIQLYGSQNDLGDDYTVFRSLDLGDIVGVTARLFVTKTGQTSLHLTSLKLLAKCLRPLPAVKEADGHVFDAFADKEQRYRMRYVDLIVNPAVREVFVTRSRIVSEIRSFLSSRGFLEVETPMMQPIPGGATARPFITHHNALDMDLYLRIAPELYLKRLVVGGLPRVFEINRNFRNEGISYKHNPEFTMLELYEAYGNMGTMMELCEELIVHVTKVVHGRLEIPYGDTTLDLTPPWKRISYLDSIREFGGVDLDPKEGAASAAKKAEKAGIKKDALTGLSFWRIAELLFDELVEAKLIQPVMITGFPLELSPLAKADPKNREFVERFEPYMAGREIGNAFSELSDPFDQKARFEEQVKVRETGTGEGGYMDHDYVRALEYGLPPTGGMGIGIDRLVMLLTNQHSIRDTIFFPLMRPEKAES